MKKLLNKIINIGYKILLIFTIICFCIAVVGATLFYINRSGNYLNPIVLIIGTIIYLLLLLRLYNFIISINEKKKKIICIVLLILQFILLLLSSMLISSIPKVDLLHILAGINSLNHTGNIINNEYFSIYPNNKFLLIVLYNIQKINPCSGHILFCITSSFCITIMTLFTYKTVKRISDINRAILSLFICVFSPIFYLYVSYYYTDILMLPIASILIYLIVKIKDEENINKNIIYGMLIGVTSIIGYKIRAVSIFLLIAYFIYLLISEKLTNILKKSIPIILTCIITIICINNIENNFFTNNDFNKEFPMTHWVMMGLNKNHRGYYNQDDYNLSISAKNVDDRIDLNINEIKNRVLKLGPSGIFKLSISKLVSVWSKGDYSYQKYLDLVKDYNTSYQYLLEDKNIVINYILQISKISILVLSIISLYKIFKSNKKSILTIAIFGAILFYLIWEVCPRYGLSFLPWLIILGSCSYNTLDLKFKNMKLENGLKFALLTLTIILFILRFDKYTSIDIRSSTISKNMTKGFSFIELNQNNIIVQSLKLNSKFNEIRLKFKVDNKINNDDLYKLELINSKGNLKFSKLFDINDIKRHHFMVFNLDKSYNKGIYYIKLSTNSKKSIEVFTSFKEEFDFYQDGKLTINNIEYKGDLMFEVMNNEKRGIYTKCEYILLMVLTIVIEYIALFGWRDEINEK